MSKLTSHNILVAGASSGIGRSIALAAANLGANLILVSRRSSHLDNVAAEIRRSTASRVLTCAADGTRGEDLHNAVGRALDQFGTIDAAVNSIGVNLPRRSLEELTFQSWSQVLRTNLDSAYLLTQSVLPVFRAQRNGLLVHISSTAAKTADRSGVSYQASKAGVAALAAATMTEERDHGVRVSVLFPGMTDTPFVQHRATPPTAEELDRALKPDDVADACMALLTLPARAYISELVIAPSRP